MENSPLIAGPFDDLHGFISGDDADNPRSPARIAWMLESAAIHHGWPAGSFIGSEGDLIARFGASRDTVREAIRVVEARGSMRMQRGRKGGLRLVRPHLDQAAGALALYLSAWGCTPATLAETVAVGEPTFARLPDDNLLIRLYRRTLEMLGGARPTDAGEAMRAIAIASRVIQSHAPIPESSVALGSEAELCEQYSCGRATLRQALRILDDLGMLQVRRGRGGGYSLTRPSPLGVVRQLFALFASRQQRLQDSVPMTWALNFTQLRLAIRALDRMDTDKRARECDALAAVLDGLSEPKRWSFLQQQVGRIADSLLIATLLDSIVAYQARLGPPPAAYGRVDAESLEIERGIVAALREGRSADAERFHRRLQGQWSELLDCPDLPGKD